MAGKEIAYYYQRLERAVDNDDDLPALIRLHIESFERHGWTVIHATEADAKQHPDYDTFNNREGVLGRTKNAWEYARACYMRWLAYATLGIPFADLDVINYGFTPDDAMRLREMNVENVPIFLSAAGAIGLFETCHYKRLLETYKEFIKNPTISGQILDDVNDMTIMREIRPEWYTFISYSDDRFVKDYTRDNWYNGKMVHYAYGLTACPRAETIRRARPLVG